MLPLRSYWMMICIMSPSELVSTLVAYAAKKCLPLGDSLSPKVCSPSRYAIVSLVPCALLLLLLLLGLAIR